MIQPLGGFRLPIHCEGSQWIWFGALYVGIDVYVYCILACFYVYICMFIFETVTSFMKFFFDLFCLTSQ